MAALYRLFKVVNLRLIFNLYVFEWFYELLEYIDKIFGLVVVLDNWFFIFVIAHLVFKLLSKASILVD